MVALEGTEKELGIKNSLLSRFRVILRFRLHTLQIILILQRLRRYPNWNWGRIGRNFRRNGVGFPSGFKPGFCSFRQSLTQICPSIGTNSDAIPEEIALDLR